MCGFFFPSDHTDFVQTESERLPSKHCRTETVPWECWGRGVLTGPEQGDAQSSSSPQQGNLQGNWGLPGGEGEGEGEGQGERRGELGVSLGSAAGDEKINRQLTRGLENKGQIFFWLIFLSKVTNEL